MVFLSHSSAWARKVTRPAASARAPSVANAIPDRIGKCDFIIDTPFVWPSGRSPRRRNHTMSLRSLCANLRRPRGILHSATRERDRRELSTRKRGHGSELLAKREDVVQRKKRPSKAGSVCWRIARRERLFRHQIYFLVQG